MRASNDLAELEAYLAQFPDGAFSVLARARQEGIKSARVEEARRAAKARSRADVEAAALRVRMDEEAAASRARAEAEAAFVRARAEAEAAAAAKARAEADAAAARRQAEVERAGALRARQEADAQAARLKAEAERAAKSKAEAEATRQQQAAVPPPPRATATRTTRFDGAWKVNRSCEPFEGLSAISESMSDIKVQDGQVVIERGTEGTPGWFRIRGTAGEDGALDLFGAGVSPMRRYYGQEFRIAIFGRFTQNGYTGSGRFGLRQCSFALTRAAT